MNKINYQKELEKILRENKSGDSLLLHSCCAPCSSYVLSYLCNFFKITVLYYNPNIGDNKEYQKRKSEQIRLLPLLSSKYPIGFLDCEYNPEDFYMATKGYETCPEGGERCFICYRLRLEKTAKIAKEKNFDRFCTTLSVSPYKNSQKINEIGSELSKKYGVPFLPSDFKKKEGYKQSNLLSKKFNLYRQNYCGCEYSKRE